ncbi:riboflavin biosynthesis protein ribd [Bacillus sp. OxB-1]|nr:riboflavin biosynthesis protein ribd [Bacillus sp. OxB-1]
MDPECRMNTALALVRTAEGQLLPNLFVDAVSVQNGQNFKAGTDSLRVKVSASAIIDADSIRDGSNDTPQHGVYPGKTPLYKDLLIQHGIRRVFMASVKPSPSVNGKGIGLFQDAGMEVVTGIVKEEAEQLNRAFIHYNIYGKPTVTMKAAVILDGRLSTRTGDSKWTTLEASRTDVHYLRPTHNAILVDVETVLHENPFLTTRLPHGGKYPICILFVRHLRTPETAYDGSGSAVKIIKFTLDPQFRKEGTVPCSLVS